MDRRSRRSRRQLKEALFALILEKGYDTVTIEDITGRADLGRTTFYLHYRDKEDLLLESIASMADELIARLPPHDWKTGEALEIPGEMVQEAILIVFRHAAENAPLYRIIFRGEGATKTSQRFHSIISQQAILLVQDRLRLGDLHLQVPADVFANYFAGALLALTTWWLEADTPYSPEEMANIFQKLFFQGARQMLGMEEQQLPIGQGTQPHDRL
jgi:AcrR family transcriptional regulator